MAGKALGGGIHSFTVFKIPSRKRIYQRQGLLNGPVSPWSLGLNGRDGEFQPVAGEQGVARKRVVVSELAFGNMAQRHFPCPVCKAHITSSSLIGKGIVNPFKVLFSQCIRPSF